MPANASALSAVEPAKVACDGDGTSGKRVEVLYVREATMPNRYTQLLPMIRAWLADVDDAYDDAAAVGGRSRHLRYVTEAVTGGCQAVVRNVVVPAGSLATFEAGNAALTTLGYTSVNRKYLTFTESTVVCGISGIQNDDQVGAANANNSGPTFARVDAVAGCFGANAAAHELGHSLGAVQLSAPHTDGSWHCLDQGDLMCYGGVPVWSCLEWNQRRLPDCNKDDYFNVNPTAGSYLATHWNIANSDFFIKGTTVDTDAHPQVGFTYSITNPATNAAIEPIGGATGTLVELSARTRTDTKSQQWLMGYQTGLQFINVNSRLCADTAYSGTTAGTHLLQYICNGQDGMRFAYTPNSDGTYGIIDWLSGLALTVPAAYPAPLEQQPYTGAANQKWTFNKITVAAPTNGTSYYVTGIDNRENMDVTGASTASGALVTHSAPSTATSQRWTLVATGSYWRLTNVNSNLCLDLVTANTTPGTQIRQATCSTTATRQQWTLRRVADGTFTLVNRSSNLVLNMTGSASSPLDQQTLNGDNRSQVWYLSPV